jgi:hypothetical protein
MLALGSPLVQAIDTAIGSGAFPDGKPGGSYSR